jgi:acetyl-CoA acetyltransferase
MHPLRNRVAVVGTSFSQIGRKVDRPLGALAVEACLGAIEDAGLRPEDIDGVANYPNPSRVGGGNVDGVDLVGVNYIARALKLRNLTWNASLTQGTFTASVVEGIHAIAAGTCTNVLVWRGMHNPGGGAGRHGSLSEAHGDDAFSLPYGLMHATMSFAFPYARYMAKFGATREHMAAFAARNRAYAASNPSSPFFDSPYSVEEYMDARMIAEPLSLLDCDMFVDGCGAVVLTSADRAGSLRRPPAYVSGHASLGLRRTNRPIMALEDFMEEARRVAEVVWATSGLRPKDIDQANLYDGFSYFVLLWLEAFGFCGEGEAFEVMSAWDAERGTCPINTNGGALGMGRLHGTPQVIEAVRQVQGCAGQHQVPDAAHTIAQVGSPLHGTAALAFSREA